MIKKVYIDGLLGALQYEAKKLFIKKDDIDISFKEECEENEDILKLIQGLGLDEEIGDYRISIDFQLKILEIHKEYSFRILRKLGTDDIFNIWTITTVELDLLNNQEA